MLDKEVKLKTLGEQERNLLKNKSPFILPDNPSEKGFNANQIKRTMYEPILLLFDWLKKQGLETAEIIELIKNAFNNLETKVHDRGVALELDEANGIIKLIGKDKSGNDIELSSIDLPTEKIIKNVYYDNATSELVFQFENANDVRVPIGDIFELDNYYTKTDTDNLFNNQQTQIDNIILENTQQQELIDNLEYENLRLTKQVKNLQASAEGSTFVYEEDSEVAYEKLVPEGASPYAVLNKVGGMSYASENLIIADDIEEKTMDGLTYSFKNGIITINGTSTATSALKILIRLKEPLPVGTYTLKNFVSIENAISKDTLSIVKSNQWETIISFAPINQTFITKETTELGYYLMYYMPTAQTYNNYKIIPMLVRGSNVPTEFVPYFEGIRNSAVTEINSNGANLIELEDVETTTQYGITYSVKNGIIRIKGTVTEELPSKFFKIYFKNQKTISISGTYSINWFYEKGSTDAKEQYVRFDTQENDGTSSTAFVLNKWNTTGGTVTETKNTTLKYILYLLYVGDVIDVTIKPMLVAGDVAPTTFKPYKQPITKTLPSAVTTLTDYGLGINEEYYNYIDFERKVYVRKVGITSLNTDTYKWHPSPNISNNSFYYVGYYPDFTIRASSSTEQIPIIHTSKEFEYSTPQLGYQGKNCITVHTTGKLLIYFNKTDYPDMGTFENFSNWINEQNIQVVYPLPQIIEEDISYLFKDVDEFIEVEELGSIRFENEFEQDVPSTITYQVKI